MKILYFPIISSLLLMAPLSLYASGSYVPSSNRLSSIDYNKGKAIFNGRVKLGQLQGCNTCHGSDNRFQRRRLRTIKPQLHDNIISCEIHQPCYQHSITEEQIEQLINYIVTRYRLD